MKIETRFKVIEIALILVCFMHLSILDYLPVWLRISIVFTLFSLLLMLVTFLIVPIIFIAAKVARHIHGTRYKQYINSIQPTIDGLGSNFTRKSLEYYNEVDALYLLSLDAIQRETVLFLREQKIHNQQQEKHNQEMLRIEKDRLREEQRARQATEELLSIERERERRYRGW